MFTHFRHHQHDIDRNSEEIDCEPDSECIDLLSSPLSCLDITSADPNMFDMDYVSNIVSVGTILSEEKKCKITSLPAEITMCILSYLDPSDLVDLSNTCSYFHNFVMKNARSLSRFDMSCVEFRVNPKIHKMNMNLLCPIRGSNRLWKTITFTSDKFINVDLFNFTRRLRIYNGCVVRLADVVFEKQCLDLLGDFIENLIKCDYPISCSREPFELQMVNCNYLRTSQKDILRFFNRMIDYGCCSLTLNNISSEDFIKVCNALGQARLQKLMVFRFHSDDITPARSEPIKKLFAPFCKKDRLTHRIVIDGIQVPLALAEWIMVAFCCTPFYFDPPPPLRVVLAIHHSYSRQELYDMLGNVRSGVNVARSKLKHRLNHVYLELGMYESDVYLTQNQHCVVDVKLMRNKNNATSRQAADE